MEARAVLKASISIVLQFSVFVVRIIIMKPYQAYRTTWDDRMLVDVIDDNHDAILEFVFGCNADAAQDRQKKIVGKNSRAY
jgi:hypothetical protein